MDRYVFHCEYGNNYVCRKGQCLCCIHCTDIYWDYSNGPYMILCKKDLEPNGDCKQWELDDSLDKYEESEEEV